MLNGDIYVSSPVTGLILHVTPGNLSDISGGEYRADVKFDRQSGEMVAIMDDNPPVPRSTSRTIRL